MKSKINKKGLLFLPIIFVLIVFLVLTDEGVKIDSEKQAVDLKFTTITEIVCDDEGNNCVEVSENSILPTQPKIADSDESFLEGILSSLDNEQIAIEVVATKYNIKGESQTFRNAFPFQLQAGSVSVDGFFIENIQVAFFVDVKESASIIIEGTAEFILDGKTVASKKIFANSPAVQNNQVPLNVGTAGTETFDFTFVDEGLVDGKDTKFDVIIKDISGELITKSGKKTVNWKLPITVYSLTIVLDEDKITKVNEDGEVITVTKSDSAVIACAQGSYEVTKTIKAHKTTSGAFAQRIIPSQMSDLVEVFSSDGLTKILEIKPFTGEPNKNTCKKEVGMERNNSYIIKINGEEFKVDTPANQHNYNIQWKYVDKKGGTNKFFDLKVTCSDYKDATHCKSGSIIFYTLTNGKIFTDISSNFGYEFTDKP